ncbi:uncharacterized protein Z520_02321 [Fonsecaea multimorphosa CBS 102226]|uniref:Elongation of fatty acids protein n=1 Tax=Fonsecaea multimorphosa CBS 102226 TaxID=1442371 RepID=A0A0D2K7X5_9EURO|nr:uncharacterized protein Z520_02321 [Fonsecaea multimorphosa CBS 102226]KIY02183.1 hypothetical protein Z520_02321 [Fonsecaea multimorphosa CBS 102226]OAL29376.1 hypothetical protein AYO22_02270 [Fonsecaea multimorphosa]
MSVSDLIDWLSLSKTSPQVKVTTLPITYFKFPPSPEPTTVPPPVNNPTFAHPFSIPADLYNVLLSAHVPITVALVYMSLVSFLNSVNANRKYKPWAFSRTYVFKLFVIVHNIFLAVYSAWTCVGMVNALHLSLPEWDQEWKVAGTVDALCKMHGPRGAGSAATYNATTSAWQMTNRIMHLAADGLGPESTDVGRIWNEGLAFYGWLFYLSKFYEVVDTLIILAKGKRSSLLQTYHHAGAMLCMWAGIRYMSPPIWMFVLVNSGIHSVMYTFYLCSAVGIKVPKWFKQTLTTLQITQFVVGATYAFLHLFVAYQIPVSIPYIYHVGGAASKIVSEAPTEITSTVSTAIATASASMGAWLKKALLRGAGYEGLAENVLNQEGQPFGVDAAHIVEDVIKREETRYRDELQWVHCLDTSGQVFAILLNCMYLLPLTWLFLQFFITSYLKQVERRRSRSASETAMVARKSFQDASKGVARRLSEAVEEMHRVSDDIGDDTVLVDGDEVRRELKEAAEHAKITIKEHSAKVKQTASANSEKVQQEFQRDMEKARKNLHDTAEKVKNAAAQAGSDETREKISAKAQAVMDSTAETVGKTMESVKSTAQNVKEQTQPAVNYVTEKASDLKAQAQPAVDYATGQAGDLKEQAGSAADYAAEKATELKERAVEASQTTTSQSQEGAQEATESGQLADDQERDSAEVDPETAKDKAEIIKQEIDENLESAKGTATEEAQSQSSVEKYTSQSKSPNGNGTAAEEETGPSANPNQSKSGETAGAETGESEEAKSEKKEEDKIIDESQVVRDEDVAADGDNKAEEEGVNGEGQSWADIAKKKPSGEEEETKEGEPDKDKEGWGI